ncbi:hypothetical protein SCT_2076 [Sulfuricella sp. T08]|uniref:ParD-like family protein n=1 Tax=Sulfuricella sp. T08 TaxID=1632857 RepID=UPI0006179F67|nr:ParD-like family protein [Sulfuricella sp. T08]GAO36666.1 hypothetical protein SCT_2076 [Sulfuricella sp. T08]
MSLPVRIDEALYEHARDVAKAEHRTIAGQIEFWATVGRTALDNPDLPTDFIVELLRAKHESRENLTRFVPGQLRG